ncbi:hypothetical protein [Luteimonas sp. R10]|uniref:hypothetical protein n=1 Tax=Luteimonas sp. R10 TaxID=3108176 RepID=UPI00308DEE0B|nr:hypothetical protein U3649_02345 [Luteimonas sp. R10]
MNEKEAIALNTSLAASRVLSLGANRLSSCLDMFSGWLLAGFGAVFGLLIANFAALSEHINASNLKQGAGIFLVAAAFAAAQKLLAAYVAAGTAAGEDGRGIGEELASGPVPLDVDSMRKPSQAGPLLAAEQF